MPTETIEQKAARLLTTGNVLLVTGRRAWCCVASTSRGRSALSSLAASRRTEVSPSVMPGGSPAQCRECWITHPVPANPVAADWRQLHLAHMPHEMSVRQDAYVGLVELSGPMNHVFIRESGVVGDNPGHSKSRGGTAHCQVATDPVRQCKEERRILRALTSTGCHIERIGRLDEKIHARVVRPSHYSVPNSLRWQAGQAHHLALGPIGTLDLVNVRRHWCSK